MSAAPKRSLFKKPAWATTTTSSAPDHDFYRHSNTVYEDIVAENEKKKQRRQEKSTDGGSPVKSDGARRDVKRRRLSHEDVDDDGDDIFPEYDSDTSASKSITESDSANQSKSEAVEPRIVTRSKGPVKSPEPPSRVKASPSKTLSRPTTNVIELDDSDDDIPATIPIPARKKEAPLPEPSDDSDSDDYVRELKRRAREKRRRELEERAKSSATPENSRPSSSSLSKDQESADIIEGSSGAAVNNGRPPLSDDPVCRLLINSPIPGTSPLIVERRASQNLREVRLFWCKRQGFDEAFSRTVFLTWRLHKLYDISTCKNLADRASSTKKSEFDDDDLFSPSADLDSENVSSFFEQSKGNITVEAMTEEYLEKAKQQQKATRDKSRNAESSTSHHGNNNYDNEEDNSASSAANLAPKEPEIRILLRARNLEDLKLKVRPSTPIWKIIGAYKDQRVKPAIEKGTLELTGGEGGSSAKDVQVILMFDGDKLEPDDLFDATGIEDTDAVDVIVR